MVPYQDFSQAEIARRLGPAKNEPPREEIRFPEGFLQGPPRPAAVLVPLLRLDSCWHLLFTRRTETLSDHSGQVAFPGGRLEPEDASPEAAALREAYEEIGLPPSSVHGLGRLNQFITISNFVITPVVGVIQWPFELRIEADEVSRVFTIPLPWLADPANYEIKQRQLPPPFPSIPVIYFKIYDGELLWGVTAHIMLNFLNVLFGEED